MSLATQVTAWADNFFSQLDLQFANRPLILAVLARVQKAVDAAIPGLVAQGITATITGLTTVIDTEFGNLEKATATIPYLSDLLKTLNVWLDAEIVKLGVSLQTSDK